MTPMTGANSRCKRWVRRLLPYTAFVALLAACSSQAPNASPSGRPTRASAAVSPSASATAPQPSASPTASRPLAGKIVVIDPGHNGGNAGAPSVINRLVDAGGFQKACDTAGTETDDGYPEYAFTLDVSMQAAALLRAQGAKVILTRTDSRGVGPCIDQRAAIGNAAHASAAISVHADGGPPNGSGFHVIEPALAPDHGNASILAASNGLALDVRAAFAQVTHEPFADYIAHQGLIARSDLGGLNLSRVPKVFIECLNMRNPVDAEHAKSAQWRTLAAEGIADGIAAFLRG